MTSFNDYEHPHLVIASESETGGSSRQINIQYTNAFIGVLKTFTRASSGC